VLVRSTANSLRRTAAGHKQDDQTAKTKPPAGGCSRILDQSLGSTRARSSRNRTLQQAGTMAGRVEGWAGHSCRSHRIPLTSHRKPEPNVDTPRLHTRWASRDAFVSSHSSLELNSCRPWFISPVEQGPGHSAVSVRSGRSLLDPQIHVNMNGRRRDGQRPYQTTSGPPSSIGRRSKSTGPRRRSETLRFSITPEHPGSSTSQKKTAATALKASLGGSDSNGEKINDLQDDKCSVNAPIYSRTNGSEWLSPTSAMNAASLKSLTVSKAPLP
jgi:hypothetical protein